MGEGKAGDPADLGVLEAAEALRAGRLSAVELAEACLRRVDERNGGPPSADGSPAAVNAWARLYPDEARVEAAAADARLRAEGDRAPLLCGIPLGVKDLYGIAGRPLEASSRVLEGHVADRDAPVVAALRGEGMVVLGHTHTHEFAAGGTTDQVGNPWDLDRTAGGSSGGSAAALAARMVPAALGTDTCGSLRIPSACCGTSTIKPTHGRLSLEGIVPLAPSLDHPGPMTRSVADAAAVLMAMAGAPEVDPRCPPPGPLALPLTPRRDRRPLAGTVCAVTDHGRGVAWDDEVETGLATARRALEDLGATVVELAAPWLLGPDDVSAVLLTEMWAYHRRHAGRADRYRPSVAELVEAASARVEAAPYLAAQERRREGTARWEAWFAVHGVDVVLEPTLPVLPPLRGAGYDRGHAGGQGDPLIALSDLWDMTGMPVVCLPVERWVGISLVAPRGAEAGLVQVAIDLQEHALGVPSFPGSGRQEAPVQGGEAGAAGR